MSQNPYAHFGGPPQQGFGGEFVDPEPARTSILAIISLVVSIVGCLACILPGPGALALILGGLAVFFIANSGGRITGMGLAVTAIVLGLLQSVACIAVLVGAAQINNAAGKEFFQPVGAMMKAVDSGDKTGARALFTPRANSAISDEMIADFAARYQAKVGKFQKTPETIVDVVRMAIETAQGAKQSGGRGRFNQRTDNGFPLPAQFEKGSAFIIIIPDPQTFGAPHPNGAHGPMQELLNIGVMTMDGTEIWLLDPAKSDALRRGRGGAPSGDGSGGSASPATDAPKPGPSSPAPGGP